jgi:hypothetical protein
MLFGTVGGYSHKKIGDITPLGLIFNVEGLYQDVLLSSSYDKIRKLVYDVLHVLNPAKLTYDVDQLFAATGTPRTKDSDSAAFLLMMNPAFSDIDRVLDEIRRRCETFTVPLPHGLLTYIRLFIENTAFTEELALKLIDVMIFLSETTSEQLS